MPGTEERLRDALSRMEGVELRKPALDKRQRWGRGSSLSGQGFGLDWGRQEYRHHEHGAHSLSDWKEEYIDEISRSGMSEEELHSITNVFKRRMASSLGWSYEKVEKILGTALQKYLEEGRV